MTTVNHSIWRSARWIFAHGSRCAALLVLIAPRALMADSPKPAAPPAAAAQPAAGARPVQQAPPLQGSLPTGLRPLEGDYVIPNFRFASGEVLPEVRLHFTTLGKARRDQHGRVTNAVLLLHGTGGSGHSFLAPRFAGVLFGKGQLLDVSRYYIILPDALGHGASSKPSDGLHAHFPQYNYQDMVSAQYAPVDPGPCMSIICA